MAAQAESSHVRQSISIENSIGHGSAIGFNLLDERFRNGAARAGWSPTDDFQHSDSCQK